MKLLQRSRVGDTFSEDRHRLPYEFLRELDNRQTWLVERDVHNPGVHRHEMNCESIERIVEEPKLVVQREKTSLRSRIWKIY